MSTLTAIDPDDPLDCPACVARRDLCDFHAGYARAWDEASRRVGALVLEARPDDEADR